jgi:hypothetical protein
MVARWLAAGLATLVLASACSSSPVTSETTSGVTSGVTSGATSGVTSGVTSDTASDTTSEVAPADTTEQQAPPSEPAAMERAVRAWSEALNAGENEVAARLFELPALVAQGPTVIEFRTYEQLAAFHEELPCSGRIVSISFDEPDVALAVFELGDRRTGPCDAPAGTRAAARFVFREGRLQAWQQVPVPEDRAATTGDPVA